MELLDQADVLPKLRTEANRRMGELVPALLYETFEAVPSATDWPEYRLVDLAHSPEDIRCGPFGTQLNKSEFRAKGVPLWGIKHVNSRFTIGTDEYVDAAKAAQLESYSLCPGDIVMTRKATVGNCALYPDGLDMGIMHSDLLRIRIDQVLCKPQFLVNALRFSQLVQRQVATSTVGATTLGINVGKLKNVVLKLPPIEWQKEFSSIVDSIDRIAFLSHSNRNQIDCALSSLLASSLRQQ